MSNRRFERNSVRQRHSARLTLRLTPWLDRALLDWPGGSKSVKARNDYNQSGLKQWLLYPSMELRLRTVTH